MKRLIIFLLLFAAIKVAGQTTGYLRFDTVKIYKQGGTAELYLINKTKDSLGVLTNIGGGLTEFRKCRVLNDSTIVVGRDTLTVRGNGGIANTNVGSAYRWLIPLTQQIKTFGAGYGILIDSTATTLIATVDTFNVATRNYVKKVADSVLTIAGTDPGGGETQLRKGIGADTSTGPDPDTLILEQEYIYNTTDKRSVVANQYIDDDMSDSNDGETETSAKQTINGAAANLSTAAWRSGYATGMIRNGGLFREKYTPANNNIRLGSYGLVSRGDPHVPQITAYDLAGAWTDTAGIYKQSWDHGIQTNQPNYHYTLIDEIDTALEKTRPLGAHYYMDLASSIADCIATPGTFFVGPLDRDPITVYVNPSDGVDPDANRYRYEITTRSFVIDATSGGTVANGGITGTILEGLRLRGNGHGYGAVGGGQHTNLYYCILEGCGTHHAVANSFNIDHVLLFGQPKNLATGSTGIVAYKGNAAGMKTRISNFISLDNPNPLLAHQSGPLSTWHDEVVVTGSYLFADSTNPGFAMGFDLIQRVVIENNYAADFDKAFSGLARNYIVRGNVFNRIRGRTGLFYPLDSAITLSMDNNFLLMEGDEDGTGMIGVQLDRETFKGNFTNNTFRNNSDARAGSNNSIMLIGSTTPQDQIKSYRNIFIIDESSGGQCNIYVGDRQNNASPYVHNIKSDSNVYIRVSGEIRWILLNPNGGSPTLTTLGDWQTKSGQDAHSYAFDCDNYPQGLKAFFVDPENGNYNLANTPQGDSIRALGAGMLTPPRFFPRKPTPDEAWASISEPGTIMDNWKFGAGAPSGGGTTVIADGSETKINAGTNVSVTGSGTVASPYVINSSGSSTDTSRFWHIDGNTLVNPRKFGAKDNKTFSHIMGNSDMAFERFNKEFIVSDDTTGITAGTGRFTVKSSPTLGGVSLVGRHLGSRSSLSISNTIQQDANTQRQIALSIDPVFDNPGAFTNPSYYALRSALALNAAAYSIEISNTGTGGANSQYIASDGSTSTLMSSLGLWQTSSVTPTLRSTSTSATWLMQVGTGQTKMLVDSGGVHISTLGTRPTQKFRISGNGFFASQGTTGYQAAFVAGVYQNTSTAASGTVAHSSVIGVEASTLGANNTGVTYTNASLLYLAGAPIAGLNLTITNPWTLYVNSGKSFFGGGTVLGAGTTSIAPLQFTSGTDHSSPAAGMWFYNGTRLGFSPSTTIKRVALTNDAAPSNGQIPIGNGTDYTAANITSSGGTVTVTNGSGTINLETALAMAQGTYTPTLTNSANLDASTVLGTTLNYTRIGNQVTVWGVITLDVTAATTTTTLGVSLPIVSAFTAIEHASGQVVSGSSGGSYGSVLADATNDRAQVNITSGSNTSELTYTIRFTYTLL